MVSNYASIIAITGILIVGLGIGISAFAYRGKQGEHYSLLNHFISELGERGVSRLAWAFNAALILGGLLLLPFVIHFGILLDSLLGWMGMLLGIVTALGVTAVGIFPMNTLKPHTAAALTFFRGGLAMVFVFGLAIQFQFSRPPVIPKLANLLSLVTFAAFAWFLSLPAWKKNPASDEPAPLDPLQQPERLRFWLMPFVEWLVFFTTILWLGGMALLV